MSTRPALAMAAAADARVSRSSCWAVSSTALASAKATLAMMSSMVSLALMSVPLRLIVRGCADSSASARRSCGYPGSPSRRQKRSTVVSDVRAAVASSLMVRPAARRASARTMSATRSSAGDREGLIPLRRMSSDALAAPAGDEPPSSVLGMGLRYGVATGRLPTGRGQRVGLVFGVEQDALAPGHPDPVEGDASTGVVRVGHEAPAQQLGARLERRPSLDPAPGPGPVDTGVGGFVGLPVVPRSLTAKATGVHVVPASVDRSRC